MIAMLKKVVGALPISLRYKVLARSHPGYYFGVFEAAILARRLGLSSITAVEFGVAGGAGLIALEQIAALAKQRYGVSVRVVGFDTGKGMPAPTDYRDVPYSWKTSDFAMDEAALRSQLTQARLILGDVRETTAQLWAEADLPPIGFISFDLDYYSSTKAAFQIFEAPRLQSYLPRTFCYFDDVIAPFGDTVDIHCDYVGELLAIREFNESHPMVKIAKINGLDTQFGITRRLHLKSYVAHFFQHPLYGQYIR